MSGLAETRIDTVDIDDSGNPDRLSIVDYSDAANRKLSILTAADTAASRYGLLTFGSDGTNVRPLATNTGGRLQVDVISGGTAGQQVADGQLATGGNSANDFGNIAVGWDGTNYQFVATNTGGRLQVDIVSGGSGGSQYADGTLIAGTIGTVAMGTDGANLQFLKTDAAGELQIDVLTLPSVTQGTSPWVVSGTVAATQSGVWNITDITGTVSLPTGAATSALQTTGNASLASIDTKLVLPAALVGGRLDVNIGNTPSVDVTDRAARLVGVVYGSQGQQLLQTATNFNLQSELAVGGTLIDPRQIRALTAADVVTAQQGTPPWQVQSNSLNIATAANQVTEIASLQLIDDLPHLNLDSITGAKGVGVLGSDGTVLRWLKLDANGSLVIAAAPTANTFFRFGDVVSAAISLLSVRRTAYTEQTSDAQRSIASASASDTSAGTGARTVTITYYNSTGAGPFTETVTLNGTAFVNTVATNICYIEGMEIVTVGSTGSNVGIITLKAATAGGGATIGTIAATDNRTFWAHHYVPTGVTFKLTGISCGHSGTTVGSGALFFLKSLPIGVANVPEVQISDFVRLYGQSSTFARSYNSPIKVVGPARIIMYVTSESASTFTYRAAFDFFEE